MIDELNKHQIGLVEASELKCILNCKPRSPLPIAAVTGNNEYEINDISASSCLVPPAVKAQPSPHEKSS
jgi:hypothetical protein